MGAKRLLLIQGWVAWAGYGCYLLSTGHTTAPWWWAIALAALIIATVVYTLLYGVEFSG